MKAAAFIVTILLLHSACSKIIFGPVVSSPEAIYQTEAERYPSSSWSYHGMKGKFHYFSNMSQPIRLNDWMIRKSFLPDLKGEKYYFQGDKRISISTDVEIHQEFIRIHVDGYPPYRIPFESEGFITAEKRLNRSIKETPSIQVEPTSRDFSLDAPRVSTIIRKNGDIETIE